MSDWPSYPSVEIHPHGATAPTAPAPAQPRGLPTWAGMTLAITIGLTVVLAAVSLLAAQQVMQLRGEVTVLRTEMAQLRTDLEDQRADLSAVEGRVVVLQSDVSTLNASHEQMREAVREAREEARRQQQTDGNSLSTGIDLMGIWNLLTSILGGF
ncbi:MAG TPA: hypothetical protein VEI97_07115 [bacterium]|nr:hypothetical protein [bacterium]